MSRSSLTSRVLSGLVLLPIVLLLVIRGEWAFLVFIELMVILGSIEFFRMARHKGTEPHQWLGAIAAAALAALMYQGHAAASGLAVTVVFLLLLDLELRRGRP